MIKRVDWLFFASYFLQEDKILFSPSFGSMEIRLLVSESSPRWRKHSNYLTSAKQEIRSWDWFFWYNLSVLLSFFFSPQVSFLFFSTFLFLFFPHLSFTLSHSFPLNVILPITLSSFFLSIPSNIRLQQKNRIKQWRRNKNKTKQQ